jgi:hypothetical protein
MIDPTEEPDDEDDAIPPAGDDAYWEKITAPLLDAIERHPVKRATLRNRFCPPSGAMLTRTFDNAIDWLEVRGRVERYQHAFGGMALRIPGKVYPPKVHGIDAAHVRAPEPAPAEVPPEAPAELEEPAAAEEPPAPAEWLTLAQAAKLLGVARTWFYQSPVNVLEKLERRERDRKTGGFEYSRASLLKLREEMASRSRWAPAPSVETQAETHQEIEASKTPPTNDVADAFEKHVVWAIRRMVKVWKEVPRSREGILADVEALLADEARGG